MIDGTGEGKVNAANVSRVEATRQNDLCFLFTQCMRRDDGDLKGRFSDENGAVAVHDCGKNDGALI
jgi:hypothetical protein